MTNRAHSGPPRAWQRMLSGRRLDLLNPSAQDIEIEDIAHGLARVARWNGQTVGRHAFSVAQHAVLVDDIVAALEPEFVPEHRLASLLHDGAEYVVGDLISPFKAAIGLDYKAFEDRLLEAIHIRFSVPYPLPESVRAAIKNADRIAAFHEATRLAGFTLEEAREFFGPEIDLPEPLAGTLAKLEAIAVEMAQSAFLERHELLSKAAGGR